MAEWFKATVLKIVVLKNTVGSNPTLSYSSGYNLIGRVSALGADGMGSSPVTPISFIVFLKIL